MNKIVHSLLSRIAVHLCEKTGTYPTPPRAKRKKRSYAMDRGGRIEGICADARELGVSHPHLWMVLKGKRKSASLLRRYRELQKTKNREVAS